MQEIVRMRFYWMASEKKIMNKGLKRKLGHHVKEIKESFQQEKSIEVKRGRKKDPGEGPGTAKTRRSRPFSVVEVFTWTCAISIMAASRGWIAPRASDFARLGSHEGC